MTTTPVQPWGGRRASQALARVRHNGQTNNTPCVICHHPINYQLRYPDPASCSVQHLHSRRDYPHLTWDPTNWAPAHLDCNSSGPTHIDLGHTSGREKI